MLNTKNVTGLKMDLEHLKELLPGITEFLEKDLAAENLSEINELKRQQFLERIEVLSFGEEPKIPSLKATPRLRKCQTIATTYRYSMPPLSRNDSIYEEPVKFLLDTQQEDKVDGDSSGTEYENDASPPALMRKPQVMLPTRAQSQSRRFSLATFPSTPWTLAGPLFYRTKPQKWLRLPLCTLTAGRLLGYKSTSSQTAFLNVFLAGFTAVYAERDSGKEYVVKLTHPVHGAHVLSADDKAEAMKWCSQMNQYSQGVTPNPQSTSSFCLPDSQEDSGFSAPVSSGSEGGSGDGVVVPPSGSQAGPTTTTATLIKPQDASTFARGGLISSMRKKVVSLGKGRKGRKSLSNVFAMNFTPAEDSIMSGVAHIRIPGSTQWRDRWCQLRPGLLEAYPLDSSTQDFALLLDDITLGLSNDKKHSSALRLSTSSVSEVLLFEVMDKIEMGSWIRGFIQALGIIPNGPYENHVDWIPVEKMGPTFPPSLQERTPRRSCPTMSTTLTINDDEPIYDEVCAGSGTYPVHRNADQAPVEIRTNHIPPPSERLLAQPLPPLPVNPENKAATWLSTSQRNSALLASKLPRSSSARAYVESRRVEESLVVSKRASIISAPEGDFQFVDEDAHISSTEESQTSVASLTHSNASISPNSCVNSIGCSLADLIARTANESSLDYNLRDSYSPYDNLTPPRQRSVSSDCVSRRVCYSPTPVGSPTCLRTQSLEEADEESEIETKHKQSHNDTADNGNYMTPRAARSVLNGLRNKLSVESTSTPSLSPSKAKRTSLERELDVIQLLKEELSILRIKKVRLETQKPAVVNFENQMEHINEQIENKKHEIDIAEEKLGKKFTIISSSSATELPPVARFESIEDLDCSE